MRQLVIRVSVVTLLLVSVPVYAQSNTSVNKLYNEGIKQYSQKNYSAAAGKFEQAMQITPNNPNIIYYCALSNQLANNRARARQLFEYIKNKFPDSQVAPLAQTALGQLGNIVVYQSESSQDNQSRIINRSLNNNPDYLVNIPYETHIPYEKYGDDIVVTASVNGHPMSFILDTGADITLMGKNQLRELGVLHSEGREKHTMGGVGNGSASAWGDTVDLKLGPIYRRNFPVVVQDDLPTRPLLGQTFLRDFVVKIDENNRTVILAKKESSAAHNLSRKGYYDKEVPFTRGPGGHMYVQAKVNGRSLSMIFDTGATLTSFSAKDWKKLGFEIPADARPSVSYGVLGATNGATFFVDTIKVGPLTQDNVQVSVIESSPGSLLGMNFFGRMKYTIDTNRNVIIFSEQ